MQKTKLIKRPVVEARTTLSRSRIYALMSQGKFPRPLRIGKRAVAWKEEDITQWIETRTEADPSEVYYRTRTKAARDPNL